MDPGSLALLPRPRRFGPVKALVWLVALPLSRWIVTCSCEWPPLHGSYDFLASVGDVALLGSASALASLLFLWRRRGTLARLAPAPGLILAGVKALARLLEPPPEARRALGRTAFVVACCVLGLSFAAEQRIYRRLQAAAEQVRETLDVELRSPGEAREEEQRTRPGESKKHVNRLLGLAWEHSGWVLSGCVALLVRLPFSIAVPHFVSEGIGAAIDHNSSDPATKLHAADRAKSAVAGLVVCGIMDSILDFFNFQLFVVVKQRVIKSLKLRLFGNIMRQELAFFDSQATGNLMSRLTADTVEMSADISFVFRFSIEAIIRVSGVAGYMFVNSWRLALLTCTIIPVNAQLNKVYADWLHSNAKRSQTALAESNVCAEEAFSGINTVKAFAKEDYQRSRYAESVQTYYELGLLQGVVTSMYYMVVSTFLMNCVVQASLVAYGALLCWRGAMAAESLVAFMLYRSQLQEWVNKILDSYTQLVRGAGASERVFELLDRRPRLQEGARRPEGAAKGRVDFLEVHFAYASRPEAPVLRGLSLEVLPGQCVALVGSSGSGKSTVFRLLLHLYEPSRGEVLLDGEKVAELLPRELCARVGVVNQEPTLFQGSVEENICYGCMEAAPLPAGAGWRHWWRLWRGDVSSAGRRGGRMASSPRVEEAAHVANAHDFIAKLPGGYSTEVGERGVQLSGGQRQRVAIARAVLGRPSVLLLDEATSALDSESERLVQEALDRAMMEQTTLVIAHRLTTVTKADRIAVLEAGCVVEQGRHEELIEAGGRYKELWDCQRDTAK